MGVVLRGGDTIPDTWKLRKSTMWLLLPECTLTDSSYLDGFGNHIISKLNLYDSAHLVLLFLELFLISGKTMFRKTVRISVNICPTDQAKQEKSSIHTISIVLESGKCLQK